MRAFASCALIGNSARFERAVLAFASGRDARLSSGVAWRHRKEVSMPRVAIITGAGAGVGRAAVTEFARHGWDVGLLSRDQGRLDAAAAEARKFGVRALPISTDFAAADAVEAAAARVPASVVGRCSPAGTATPCGPSSAWQSCAASVGSRSGGADLPPASARSGVERGEAAPCHLTITI
ncbi:MAG: SDR family NAD(P)-dependent oxidoreductase [Acetobacteraceae bacterium]